MTDRTAEAITAKRKFTLTHCSRSFNSWLVVLEPVAKQNLMVGGCGSSYSPQNGRKNKKEDGISILRFSSRALPPMTLKLQEHQALCLEMFYNKNHKKIPFSGSSRQSLLSSDILSHNITWNVNHTPIVTIFCCQTKITDSACFK